jgi:signal transduction histidine kinase
VIDALVADVNTSIASVRQIANELRPVLLDKLGLLAALEWLIKEFEKKTAVAGEFKTIGMPPAMGQVLEINIFRICQEALTNIARHAHASQVEIRLENTANRLSVKITDNGIGIRLATLHNPLSMGLLNMKERASLIGAELIVSSSATTGTIIELILNNHGK